MILVRNTFQLKFGAAKQAVALWKEGKAMMKDAGFSDDLRLCAVELQEEVQELHDEVGRSLRNEKRAAERILELLKLRREPARHLRHGFLCLRLDLLTLLLRLGGHDGVGAQSCKDFRINLKYIFKMIWNRRVMLQNVVFRRITSEAQ